MIRSPQVIRSCHGCTGQNGANASNASCLDQDAVCHGCLESILATPLGPATGFSDTLLGFYSDIQKSLSPITFCRDRRSALGNTLNGLSGNPKENPGICLLRG